MTESKRINQKVLGELFKDLDEEIFVSALQKIDINEIPDDRQPETWKIRYQNNDYPVKYVMEYINNEYFKNELTLAVPDGTPKMYNDFLNKKIPNPLTFQIVHLDNKVKETENIGALTFEKYFVQPKKHRNTFYILKDNYDVPKDWVMLIRKNEQSIYLCVHESKKRDKDTDFFNHVQTSSVIKGNKSKTGGQKLIDFDWNDYRDRKYYHIINDAMFYACNVDRVQDLVQIFPDIKQHIYKLLENNKIENNNKNKYRILPGNPNDYEHDKMFKEQGFIDWKKGDKKFSIGDIVYIYISSPVQKIRYKTIVEKINLQFIDIFDDKKYWKDIQKYEDGKLLNKYVRLKLLSVSDNDNLKLDKLIKMGFLKGAIQSSMVIADNIDFVNYLEKYFNEIPQQPKNQILYGPPGTGKTYNTVVETMRIIDPALIQYYEYNLEEKKEDKKYKKDDKVVNYQFLKDKFDILKKQGRIEFVTFHQSYSYEEFVEGIKPVLNAENIMYEKKEGVFKRICNNSKMISTDKTTSEIDFSKTRIFKLSLGRKNGDDTLDIFNYCIENNVIALGWGEDRDFSSCSTPEEFQKVDASWGAKAVEIFKNWMRIGDIVLISDGLYSIKAIARLTGDYSYRTDSEIRYCQFREVEWLYVGDNIPVSKFNSKNLSQQTIYGFYNSDLENSDNYHPTLNTDFINQIITGEINNAKQEPYVLIIDEINRGNISKIFGELITLIEEDKRLGEPNEVTVKLPYSDVNDQPFGVPSNLYIIGTMNTSDRSIASVDIALRRRFKFKEMMPKSDLVADFGIGFSYIFEQLNQRISILLDRDHQIGHSYFIKDKYEGAGIKELKQIWFDSIIPLLNEYFYGDWEKLNLVIPGFISSTKIPDYLKEACDDEYYHGFITEKDFSTDDYKSVFKSYKFKTIEQFEDNNEFRLAITQEKTSEND